MRQLLPADFHSALGALISQIVAHHIAEWRELLLASQVSEPRLLDTNWRVDVKAASNHCEGSSVLICRASTLPRSLSLVATRTSQPLTPHPPSTLPPARSNEDGSANMFRQSPGSPIFVRSPRGISRTSDAALPRKPLTPPISSTLNPSPTSTPPLSLIQTLTPLPCDHQVQGRQERRDELAPVSNVTFELSKEELGTMLDGLVKIRDQLSGVAQ